MEANGIFSFRYYRFNILEVRSFNECLGSLDTKRELKNPTNSISDGRAASAQLGQLFQLGHFGMLLNGIDARFRLHVHGERMVTRWKVRHKK